MKNELLGKDERVRRRGRRSPEEYQIDKRLRALGKRKWDIQGEIALTLVAGVPVVFDSCMVPFLKNYIFRLNKPHGVNRICVDVTFNGKRSSIQVARLLMGMPSFSIDHANGNPLDNRLFNLRMATSSQNNTNKAGYGKYHKGVTKRSGRNGFGAHVIFQRKRVHIGTFASEKEAAIARDVACNYLCGSFSRMNFEESKLLDPKEFPFFEMIQKLKGGE